MDLFSCSYRNAGAGAAVHRVRCLSCGKKFDVLAADWCGCVVEGETRTKVCPECGECMCSRPESSDPACWIEPPSRFRSRGFARLLVYYL